MTRPPIGGTDALRASIRKLEHVERSSLGALSILTGTFSSLGFVYQFESPSPETYLIAIMFGFGVWIIARMFWAGASILPEFVTGRLLLPFFVFAFVGFSAFATVSFFGNQRVVAAQTSSELAQEDAGDALANARDAVVRHWAQLDPVLADVRARQARMGDAATQEADGTGPTGQSGRGSVYRSFVAGESAYGKAGDLLDAKVQDVSARLSTTSTLLDEFATIRANPELSNAERRAQLKTISNKLRNALSGLVGLDAAGTVQSVAAIAANGVPNQSGARASSRARIAEINASMARHAASLRDQADAIAASLPAVPKAQSQSQAEHLMANILRMPGLSLAALLFDACGWLILGFRMIACQVLRDRMRDPEPDPFDDYITRDDLQRIVRMAGHLGTARDDLKGVQSGKPVVKSLTDSREMSDG